MKKSLSYTRKPGSQVVAAVFEVADFVEAAHDFGGHVDVYEAAVEKEVGKGGNAAYVHAVVARHGNTAKHTPELLQKVIYAVHRDFCII